MKAILNVVDAFGTIIKNMEMICEKKEMSVRIEAI